MKLFFDGIHPIPEKRKEKKQRREKKEEKQGRSREGREGKEIRFWFDLVLLILWLL